MNKYQEFSSYILKEDKKNPFCHLYEDQEGNQFYVEPLFYSLWKNFLERYPSEKEKFFQAMIEFIKKNHHVILTGMDEEFEEAPVTKAEGFIILNFYDITDKIGVYINNNSRGSDYGD